LFALNLNGLFALRVEAWAGPRTQAAAAKEMAHLARYHFDRPSYERPRRRSRVWAFVRRYIELFLMIGGICVAWLGAAFGYNYL
jgi:hypothetical protein